MVLEANGRPQRHGTAQVRRSPLTGPKAAARVRARPLSEGKLGTLGGGYHAPRRRLALLLDNGVLGRLLGHVRRLGLVFEQHLVAARAHIQGAGQLSNGVTGVQRAASIL